MQFFFGGGGGGGVFTFHVYAYIARRCFVSSLEGPNIQGKQ